jgi:membrane-bound metal-dependent hydrolase YbcI (DUF457 family)
MRNEPQGWQQRLDRTNPYPAKLRSNWTARPPILGPTNLLSATLLRMDTITHGIAGALIGKALFRGQDLVAKGPVTRQRVITWSLMLGAIFPDADVFRDMFSKDPMLILTWHRSVTHSLVCLPIWALLLAALTGWLVRSRHGEAPPFWALTGIYAIGILSHIVLDLVTSFGTMIWSPLGWSRPAWDFIFIIDLTLTAIVLLPQLVAWVNANRERATRRMLLMCAIFVPAPFVVSILLQNVGAPISTLTILLATAFLAAVFLLPTLGTWGARVSYAAWNRSGLLAACAYIIAAAYAHHGALERVRQFAAFEHLDVNALGALPLPPSLWHWDGLVRTPRGVYEFRTDLAAQPAFQQAKVGASATPSAQGAIEYKFYPDARGNSYIEQAKQLPEVQKVLWFARFPVVRFYREGQDAVVEISDLRFPQVRRDRPASFTYQVRFDASGKAVSQGWLKD